MCCNKCCCNKCCLSGCNFDECCCNKCCNIKSCSTCLYNLYFGKYGICCKCDFNNNCNSTLLYNC